MCFLNLIINFGHNPLKKKYLQITCVYFKWNSSQQYLSLYLHIFYYFLKLFFLFWAKYHRKITLLAYVITLVNKSDIIIFVSLFVYRMGLVAKRPTLLLHPGFGQAGYPGGFQAELSLSLSRVCIHLCVRTFMCMPSQADPYFSLLTNSNPVASGCQTPQSSQFMRLTPTGERTLASEWIRGVPKPLAYRACHSRREIIFWKRHREACSMIENAVCPSTLPSLFF